MYLRLEENDMALGLKRGTVIVEPHKTEWEIAAREIISILKQIMKEDIIDAQHIGSTSIKSICAKPIIDIAMGVSSFDKIMKYTDALNVKGIIYRGEDHPNQHLFVCGDLENDIHTHYIHAVIWGQESWNNYLNMRDYLNLHEDRAKEYSELKERLAKEYPEDRMAYTNGKASFIENILRCAEEWRK